MKPLEGKVAVVAGAQAYPFTDADGSRPDGGTAFAKAYGRYTGFDETLYAYWAEGPIKIVYPD